MTEEARERSFDALARGLASGNVSRREVLKWLGAALLGGALAFTPKEAEAVGSICGGPPFRLCGDRCINSDFRFCCRGRGNDPISCPNDQQCCIQEGELTCQPVGSECSGRVRKAH